MKHLKAAMAAVLLSGVVLLSAESGIVPTEAITNDGTIVLLYPDGTWTFKPAEQPKSESDDRERPAAATSTLSSVKNFFTLWYDPEKWITPGGISNPAAEFTLRHKAGDAYAMFIIERIEIEPGALRDIAIDNARSASSALTVLEEREIIVNGQPVLSVVTEIVAKGIKMNFLYYFHTGADGAIQGVTWAPTLVFRDARDDLEGLLNGMIISAPE